MATTVSYNIQTEPASIYGGSSVFQGQYPMAGSLAPAPFAPNHSGMNLNASYMPSASSNVLADAAIRSRGVNPDVSTAVSHVSGVVPTGLFTSYVPANSVTVKDTDHVHGSAKKPVTVYYTDDLYPPYYTKAKKVIPHLGPVRPTHPVCGLVPLGSAETP
ncbi:hypothetical protein GNI_076370 [Gregarina niphandrodes]|uniref:Uncharacterized protein n=1 Tax=Gregarina niphandrodes TaxID=110365 RepID=A0A023B6V6_GRENI|nr:hypothetical protein GNI_076370 [Gregarina niphandrodes]EZG66756.1 hypothetical protein GNI_076370 [Gregarina niphandrodes]|eukprot:XP_011130499.1 hypothetical protein GNI_076370 [Gregarina niphandrodes]